MAANPFGHKAFKQGDPAKVAVPKGEALSVRYGILLHSGDDFSPQKAYGDYLKITVPK